LTGGNAKTKEMVIPWQGIGGWVEGKGTILLHQGRNELRIESCGVFKNRGELWKKVQERGGGA